ncbi:MAG: arsenosugar biosynthesis radical SAM (seleno)protein ArsS [Phycisphaerales bacterium]
MSSVIELPILDRPKFHAQFERELRRLSLRTLQINIGRVCNLACNHCHVESSPARSGPEDNMSRATARRVVDWALDQPSFEVVDFTGGSPEMNPNFRWMVEAFYGAGWHVMSRCNPTIIDYRGWKAPEDYSWIPAFYAKHGVEVVASMPCYLEDNVDRQRGRGSYDASISGLLQLNAVGYGCDPNLRLNLVYNPTGASLPPPQESLEADYKRELRSRFGVVFNELWTITNMPIKRWRHELERDGKLEPYMLKLIDAFNAGTLDGLMCRHQINIGPDGRLYDCDFNQALEMETPGFDGRAIWQVTADELLDGLIATGDHCYGCTAGAGSSCGGAIA